jgi:hypothetical protein
MIGRCSQKDAELFRNVHVFLHSKGLSSTKDKNAAVDEKSAENSVKRANVQASVDAGCCCATSFE